MQKPKKPQYDYEPMPEEYIDFDEDGTLIDDEINEDVLDNDVESLDEIQEKEKEEYYDEDGYGGGVEGIYNWDEWNQVDRSRFHASINNKQIEEIWT